MKLLATSSILSILTSISTAVAGNTTSGNKLQCFSGTEDGGFNGTCELLADGCAYLDTFDEDADPNNSYAGVYITPGLPAKPIGSVNKLSFTYVIDEDGSAGGTAGVAGGSPRFSIPIDENGDGTTEAYAFIDAANCGQIGATSGTVDLSCPVAYGSTLYADWADFAANNPTFRISRDALPFVIVDQPFQGTICNVQLGKADAKTK